jgi:cardiolipin synthase
MVNIPNLLTLFRFALVPLYLGVFFSSMKLNMAWALCILALAGLTDVLDGYIARKYKWVTPLGILFDPLADKLMMLAVLVSFVIDRRIPWWMAALLIVREGVMIVWAAVFHLRRRKMIAASVWGKATTVVYYVTVVAVLFQTPFMNALLWLTVALSILTSLTYLRSFLILNREARGEKGGDGPDRKTKPGPDSGGGYSRRVPRESEKRSGS